MTNGNFRQIINQLDMRWRRRVPVIHQTETAECGLACTAMICGHFGKNIDLISLRRKFNLSARGANLAGINGIAEQLGMITGLFHWSWMNLVPSKCRVFSTGISVTSSCWSA